MVSPRRVIPHDHTSFFFAAMSATCLLGWTGWRGAPKRVDDKLLCDKSFFFFFFSFWRIFSFFRAREVVRLSYKLSSSSSSYCGPPGILDISSIRYWHNVRGSSWRYRPSKEKAAREGGGKRFLENESNPQALGYLFSPTSSTRSFFFESARGTGRAGRDKLV